MNLCFIHLYLSALALSRCFSVIPIFRINYPGKFSMKIVNFTHGHNILRIFEFFLQIFLSLEVKHIVITSNKNGIYEMPHELPNDLRLGS